ncbi:MAG: alpha/beta fold hydrolase, partial [Actinomycetota bacterium]|nr:alpha/beta fold hydrolase [Actinomycetota bacterium]
VRAPVRIPLLAAAQLAARLGLLDRHDVRELGRIWDGLRDPSTRTAFLRTLRGVVDIRGQAVSSRDRLYLTAAVPMLLVWGAHDRVLPVGHATALAEELPGCHLEVVPRAGHLPHQADPQRFCEVVTSFVATHDVAAHDAGRWRALLGTGTAVRVG